MIKITNCAQCSDTLSITDIEKTQTVRNQYTAVTYACPTCGHNFNEVYKTELFLKAIEKAKGESMDMEHAIKVFAFDLECINDVEMFMAYASTGKAPRENPTRKCGCGNCGR